MSVTSPDGKNHVTWPAFVFWHQTKLHFRQTNVSMPLMSVGSSSLALGLPHLVQVVTRGVDSDNGGLFIALYRECTGDCRARLEPAHGLFVDE